MIYTTPASQWQRYIDIETSRGSYKLRPTLSDTCLIAILEQHSASTPNLVSQIIRHQIGEPKVELDDILTWTDKDLRRILSVWSDEIGLTVQDATEREFFELFRQRSQEYAADWLRRTSERTRVAFSQIQVQMAQMANLMSSIVIDMSGTLAQLTKSFSDFGASIYSNYVFQSLPDLSKLFDPLEQSLRGRAVVDAAGYGFAVPVLTWNFLAKLAKTREISPKVRSAVTTNRLLAVTRSAEFHDALMTVFGSSPLLSRRLKVVEAVLHAHHNRNYLLSIPALLAQVEGVLGDLLLLRGLVCIKGGKVYAKDLNGKAKMNTKGKMVELNGLSRLVSHSKLRDQDQFKALVQYITDEFIPGRNQIMHGRKTAYGQAHRSAQALFVLLILSRVVADLENGQMETC